MSVRELIAIFISIWAPEHWFKNEKNFFEYTDSKSKFIMWLVWFHENNFFDLKIGPFSRKMDFLFAVKVVKRQTKKIYEFSFLRFQWYIICRGSEKVLRCPFAVEDNDHKGKMKNSSSSFSKNEKVIKLPLRIITNPLKSNINRFFTLDRHYSSKLDFVIFPIILPPSYANSTKISQNKLKNRLIIPQLGRNSDNLMKAKQSSS